MNLVVQAQQGDKRSMELLVRHNGLFIRKLAMRFGARYGEHQNIWDTFSVCRMGFMEGVMRFDVTRGTRLSTYTAWWMRRALQEASSHQTRTISIPDHALTDFIALRYADHSSLSTTSDEELSTKTGVALSYVRALRPHLASVLSFDAPVTSNSLGHSLTQTLLDKVSDGSLSIETIAQQRELQASLECAIQEHLNERERTVLKLRFWDEQDLVPAGKSLGISGERVRQIQNGALITLRRVLKRYTP